MKFFYLMALSIVILISPQLSSAQKELSFEKIKYPVTVDLPFHVARIEDNTRRENLGNVYVGITNTLNTLSLENGMDEEVRTFLMNNFIADASSAHLVMVINNLSVAEEVRSSTEYGYVSLHVDYFVRTDSGLVHLVEYKDRLVHKGADVTYKHDDNLCRLISRSLSLAKKNYLSRNYSIEVLNEYEFEEFLKSKVNRRTKELILFMDRNKGVYKSFEDYLANDPTNMTLQFKADQYFADPENEIVLTRYIVKDSLNKKLKDVWGIITDHEFLIQYQKRYYPIKFNEAQAFIEVLDPTKSQNVVAGAVVGGVIGAVLAETLTKDHILKYGIDGSNGIVIISPIGEITTK